MRSLLQTGGRGSTSYINEPYVTGGNPIQSSKSDVMFNDMLGNTLGVKTEKFFHPVKMTAFGETTDKEAMFTGNPYINERGYAFLFRNYRAEQGKWNSQDPIGYPDGWNNLAYVNNGVTSAIDLFGAEIITIVLKYGTWSAWSNWYEIGRRPDPTSPWIYWQRDRSRTNKVQNYKVDISYNTDNNGLMWANIRAGTALAVGVSGPLGWVVFAAVTINQVVYQLFLPPGSRLIMYGLQRETRIVNWTLKQSA